MVLFLGGPLHGQRLDVDPRLGEYVYLEPERPEFLPIDPEVEVTTSPREFKKLVYVRTSLALARFETVPLFFPVGWSEWRQMSALRAFLD